MKTLVTHINPHLDDIAGIWLLRRFDPSFKDAELEFISASHDIAEKEETENKVFVGTGGGKFDEHKEGSTDCAASLVWQDLQTKGLAPQDEISQKALEELLDWNKLIDTGKAPDSQFGAFSVQAFIRPRDNSKESSVRAVQLGEEILDRILEVLKRKQQSLKDWQNRVEFESKLGRSFAVKSKTIDRPFCKEQGGDLFLMYDPESLAVQYFTPSHEIDLKPLYDKLKQVDSEASWFLHQSHHMILCGSGAQPEFTPTNLSFEKLVEVAKDL